MNICKIYFLLFILTIAKSADLDQIKNVETQQNRLKLFKNLLEKNFEESLEKAYSEAKKEMQNKNEKNSETKSQALNNLINKLKSPNDQSEKRKLRNNKLGEEYTVYPYHNQKINIPLKSYSKKNFRNSELQPIHLDDSERLDEEFNFDVTKFLNKRNDQKIRKNFVRNSKWNPIDLRSSYPVTKKRSRLRKRIVRKRTVRKRKRRTRRTRRKRKSIVKNLNITENEGNFVENLMKTLMDPKFQNPVQNSLDIVNKEIEKKTKKRNNFFRNQKKIEKQESAKRRNNLRHNNLRKKLAARRNNHFLNKKINSGRNELFELYSDPQELSFPNLNNSPNLSILDHIINPSVQKNKKLLTNKMMEKLNIPHYPILNPSFRLNKVKKRMNFPKLGHRSNKIFTPTFARLKKTAKKKRTIHKKNLLNNDSTLNDILENIFSQDNISKNAYKSISKKKDNYKDDLFNSERPFSQHLFTDSHLHAETPTHHIISKISTEHHKIPKKRQNFEKVVSIDPVEFARDMGFFKKKMI